MNTMPRSYSATVMPFVLLLVICLGGWMWYLQPEHSWMWAVSMFMLPAAWGVLALSMNTNSSFPTTEQKWIRLKSVLTGAGLILAIALGLALLSSHGIVDRTFSKRTTGIILGLVVVVYGNAIPKMLTPLTAAKCSPAKEQSLHRFTGWTFVLSGLGYSVAWLFMPLDHARSVAMLVMGAGLLVVLARVALTYRGASNGHARDE